VCLGIVHQEKDVFEEYESSTAWCLGALLAWSLDPRSVCLLVLCHPFQCVSLYEIKKWLKWWLGIIWECLLWSLNDANALFLYLYYSKEPRCKPVTTIWLNVLKTWGRREKKSIAWLLKRRKRRQRFKMTCASWLVRKPVSRTGIMHSPWCTPCSLSVLYAFNCVANVMV